jgi:aldehyde:ferredoxin oxidoreductase
MSHLHSLLKCNDICNRYGLDTISAGATIAFALECFEAGLITESDTDGLLLHWGNYRAIIELLEQLGLRRGFGGLLSDGTRQAAERIGQGALDYAIQIAGQELAMHDPRYEPGLGLVYLADATPGRHTQASQYIPAQGLISGGYPGFGQQREKQQNRGSYMKRMSCMMHAVNASGLCLFGYLSTTVSMLPECLTAVTGSHYDLDSTLECGERIASIRQSFNLREGFHLTKLAIPRRAYGIPPLESGPTSGFTVDVKSRLAEHLDNMDWSRATAVPSQGRLEQLSLHDVASDLHDPE